MKNAFTLLPAILLATLVLGQKKTQPVTVADLKQTSCPFEPEANAMKVFDIQETDFSLNYPSYLKTERKVRIKIFNEKGFRHANISIPYFNKKGLSKIKVLYAVIYNLSPAGKVTSERLWNNDFFKENAADYMGIVSFTFPGLKAGSIIEYSYTIIENNIALVKPWHIQDRIPVQHTSVLFTAPYQTKIIERLSGTDSVFKDHYYLKNDTYQRLFFAKENVPSFRIEPYMSSISDHLMRMTFRVYPYGGDYTSKNPSNEQHWAAMASHVTRLVNNRKFLEDTIPGTQPIIDSAKAMTSTERKVKYLFAAVKRQAPAEAEQTTSFDNLADAWVNKNGTTAEVNLLLMNLLIKAGLDCYPLLISTKSNGKVNKSFASISQMNGIDVVVIDSARSFVLDASLKYQSYSTPPINILNREAFLLDGDNSRWVMIEDERPLVKQNCYILSDLTEEGKIDGNATIQYFDYAKAMLLDTLLTRARRLEQDDFVETNPFDLKILSRISENKDDNDQPLTENIAFLYDPHRNDNFIFVNPRVMYGADKNPFVADKRQTDIDMGSGQYSLLTFEIHFPKGFTVEHLPANVTLRAQDSSFLFTATYSANAENVFIMQKFESKRAIFTAEEYPAIQDFFRKMYGLMAEEIIIKKHK